MLLAVHADGQYQSNTFQESLVAQLGKTESSDEFFITSWDVSHWKDLVMGDLREDGSTEDDEDETKYQVGNYNKHMFQRIMQFVPAERLLLILEKIYKFC